jgi:hypothetical protein
LISQDEVVAMFFLRMIKRLRAYLGHDKYSAETFDRLIHSTHVDDLRWIVDITASAATVAIIVIFLIAVVELFAGSKLHDVLVQAGTFLGAVFAVFGAIIAWCYQTGSGRLGIVDLFACEITTLCRICTINGLADTCIAAFIAETMSEEGKLIKMREQFGLFESSETYTPVFDANAKELYSLSVKVVTNITAFYTYWKATRDAFRKLAKIQPADDEAWHRAMREVMYLQFLACESARKAVRDLIEFEPNNAENTITILITELPLYGFLLGRFQDNDIRKERLELRRSRYKIVVPLVYRHADDGFAKYGNATKAKKLLPRLAEDDLEELSRDWDKAYKLLGELKHRYKAAIGEPLYAETGTLR